jgi:hypothetical protein
LPAGNLSITRVPNASSSTRLGARPHRPPLTPDIDTAIHAFAAYGLAFSGGRNPFRNVSSWYFSGVADMGSLSKIDYLNSDI